ncbi:MAG: excinuclease ABC subunit UvrA [Planctomycetes bacterium]|nr:excinuclease ABC subunit UvrA [Planctomycetota bacterium]MCB9904030.1 excinuclease ABC subunit UvrA [Planctomycetota bacterium]
MSSGSIQIRHARQNNLRGVDLEIPRHRLVGVTGVSGSGKSSLAFDTLYREGQRRFLETLSAYARQFLGRMEKPDVESIEGLSPAIAVDQKSIGRGSRSTVGTLTEIVDHLRVLYARAGMAHCPDCGQPVRSQTPEAIVQQILRAHDGRKIQLLAPVVRGRKGYHKSVLEDLLKKGFIRARVDGEVLRIEDVGELQRYARHDIEAVIDRLKPNVEDPARLREAVESALEVGDGDLIVMGEEGDEHHSTLRSCPGCGGELPLLEPRLFSFNSPHGACPGCEGLGIVREPAEDSIVQDAALSIRDGALAVTRAAGGALLFPRVDWAFLERVGEAHGFDLDTPWKQLSEHARSIVLRGAGEDRFEDEASWNGARYKGSARWMRRYKGIIPSLLEAQNKGAHKKLARRYLSEVVCPACNGSRLKPAAGAVLLGGRPLTDFTHCAISQLPESLGRLELTDREARIARDLLSEIRRRVDFLIALGLGYLSLDRPADSLSGGEAQRIRLAAQLGAGLQGVLYVLDEPSIGLHWRDQGRLLGALRRLRDAGNTVIVVEHDEATLRAADYLIDVGPGAGSRGGTITGAGSPAEIAKLDTPTGRMLRGEIEMPAPEERRKGSGEALTLRGLKAFNLKGFDVSFPLGTLTAVTGVSGSGKSTLVERVLRRAVERHLGREAPQPAKHEGVDGLKLIDELVAIDAAPIGRTPRSNPATYTGVFTHVRDVFAGLPESRMRGYEKGRFSFNVAGGRCEACQGAGANFVELQFLAPVTVPCEECGGHRFQEETLEVRYRGHSIADVLALTIEDALELFQDHPKIARQLELLVEIGLGYLTLGQPSTTLSGGEAQRIKLAKELSKRALKHTLYLLDEPTTGLHMADVERLVHALQELVERGHTVVVIEHDLELIGAADHVIDLGPEGGEAGGELIVQGTPEEVMACAASHTGRALRARSGARSAEDGVRMAEITEAHPSTTISVVEARTHNLRGLSVDIPRDKFTVVTGPSGSGKSSLALDTIHTEGRRRFVESLSTYARQFLGTKDKPPVERIDGLGPSVAVEARTARGGPRSTVATTTEIHDLLRVLWARAGTPRCPEHGDPLTHGDAGSVARRVVKDFDGQLGWILAPIFGPGLEEPLDPTAELAARAESWRSAGFVRGMVDGVEFRLDQDLPQLEPGHALDLVMDRVRFDAESKGRVAEAIEHAEALTGGRIRVRAKDGLQREYATRGVCPQCGFHLPQEPEPRHFSFNTHVGACEQCDGLGEQLQCEEALLITDMDQPLTEGAIPGKLGRYLVKGKGYYELLLRAVAKSHRIDLEKPYEQLTEAQRALLANGVGTRKNYSVTQERHSENLEMESSFSSDWPGICGHVDAWHGKAEDPEWRAILEEVMSRTTCRACEGERLQPAWRAVTLGRKRLPQMLKLSVSEALEWADSLKLTKANAEAVGPVAQELRSRLSLLDQVGLGYLTLDRRTATLSGGEARRVRLSASLGSQLVGVCYVLDEPTVGLHPQDIERLSGALLGMRDQGNTVLVVEHDPHMMMAADWIVDIGPGAGRMGGTLVASGTPADVMKDGKSLTAQALRGELRVERDVEESDAHVESLPAARPIQLTGAKVHNLKGVDLEVLYGELLGVCGPSGSGKSSLVLEALVPAMRGERPGGRWKSIRGAAAARVVLVDASPVGRTPASTPATYSGLLEPLRELYSRTPEAKLRGFGPAHFSYNSTRGRCLACDGRGATKVEMQFLPDLWLSCEECDGARYRPEILEVRFRGKNIADVLAMSVDEALDFLAHQPAAAKILRTLHEVGLGYLGLGQSSTTLSGGEAQRLKLASELMRARDGVRSVIVLDEPTTGLATSDVVHLVRVLDRLVQRGNAVVVIEHDTDVLEICDRLVEIGPCGGDGGGRVISQGTPRELHANPESITGPYLFRSRELKPKSTSRSTGGTSKKSKTRRKSAVRGGSRG